MATDENVDTSRAVVKTYVPAYQKDEWRRHAEELDMSQSEFVRTMVQAGRRGFLDPETSTSDTDDGTPTTTGEDLATRVRTVLSTEEHLGWEELLATLTDDIEDRLEDALADLQEDNVVRYSGRHDGYTLVEEP